MKSPHRIGLPPGMRVLYIERQEEKQELMYVGPHHTDYEYKITEQGHFKLWLHTSDRVLGTFLKLYDNGKIERITVRSTENDEIVLIKPEDCVL